MSQFEETCARLLDVVEQDMRSAFRVRRDAMIEGRWVALEAYFNVESDRKLLGLVAMGGKSRCQENCLFVPVETLETDGFDALTSYAERVHQAVIKPDPMHEFSMVSLVMITNGISPEIKKKLKKYSFERRYSAPQNGWSTIRVAVIDLSDRKIFFNQSGTALADRLKPSVKQI